MANEQNATPTAPFHQRGWISFVVGLSAVVLLISGIVLFIAPSRRMAATVHWAMLSLDRDDWINLHNVFAILFVGAVIWHLFFNWSTFSNYVVARRTHRLNLKREMLAAALLLLFFVVAVSQQLPPVDSLSDLSNYFHQDYWK